MGTPATTFIYDEEGDLLLAFYRQSDGYPEVHGTELKGFCRGYKIVNGLHDETEKTANGMGDFAAQCLMHFKQASPIGQIYVLSPKTMRDWRRDYEYKISYAHATPAHLPSQYGQVLLETISS